MYFHSKVTLSSHFVCAGVLFALQLSTLSSGLYVTAVASSITIVRKMRAEQYNPPHKQQKDYQSNLAYGECPWERQVYFI